MKITRLTFKNVYGITERELEPKDVNIISGQNGSGKTSILDALKTTFTNKGFRPKVIKNGETEAQMIVETDSGLTIERNKNSEKSDSVKLTNQDGKIASPEGFLKNLFNNEQFNPIKDFIEKTPKEQAKVLLSLCKINFGREDFIKEFDELPQDYDGDLHVLENLEKIQSKNGKYYLSREEINREKRHKEFTRDEIGKTIPNGFDAEYYSRVDVSEFYADVQKALENNKTIDELSSTIELKRSELENIEGRFQKKVKDIAEIYELKAKKRYEEITDIDKQIQELALKKVEIQTEINGLAEMEQKEIRALEVQKDEWINQTKQNIALKKDSLAEKSYIEVEPLKSKADEVASMKEYLREHARMEQYNEQIAKLREQSDELTKKIEKARNLPHELLAKADMPINGITIENGELLIKGLPIDNLSDGEKLEIALEVAKEKAGELKVILVDGFEKLDATRQEAFIEKAKGTGLQFFITKVGNSEEVEIMSL